MYEETYSSFLERYYPRRQFALFRKAAEVGYDELFTYLYESCGMPKHSLVCPSLLFLATDTSRPDLVCYMIKTGKYRYSEMFHDVMQSSTDVYKSSKWTLSPWSVVLETGNKDFLQYIIEHTPDMTLDEIFGKEERHSLVHMAAQYNAFDFLQYLLLLKPDSIKWLNGAGESVLSCGSGHGLTMTYFLYDKYPNILLEEYESSKCLHNALRIGLNVSNPNLSEMPQVVLFFTAKTTNLLERGTNIEKVLQIVYEKVKESSNYNETSSELLETSLEIFKIILNANRREEDVKEMKIYNWYHLCRKLSALSKWRIVLQGGNLFPAKYIAKLVFPTESMKALFEIMLLLAYPGNMVLLQETGRMFILQILEQIKAGYIRNLEDDEMVEHTNLKPLISFVKYVTREILHRNYFQLDETIFRLDHHFCVIPLILNTMDQTSYYKILPRLVDYCEVEQSTFSHQNDIIRDVHRTLWEKNKKRLSELTPLPLSNICRRTVYHSMSGCIFDKIQQLPIPPKLIAFILSFE